MLTRLFFWALAAVNAAGLAGYYIEGTRAWGRVGRDWDLVISVAHLPADRLPELGGHHWSGFCVVCLFCAVGWAAILLLVHLAPHEPTRATQTPAQPPAPAPGQTS